MKATPGHAGIGQDRATMEAQLGLAKIGQDIARVEVLLRPIAMKQGWQGAIKTGPL